MQDRGYELRRMPLLGTSVNKGESKGRGILRPSDYRDRGRLAASNQSGASGTLPGDVRLRLVPSLRTNLTSHFSAP
jgi:hypothetical protein